MNSYIHHCLLVINETVNTEDPVLIECMKMAFQWANDMGMKGKRVSSLTLKNPDPNEYNPLKQHKTLWCKIDCTDEERIKWDEIQELNIKHAVNTLLKDDNADN